VFCFFSFHVCFVGLPSSSLLHTPAIWSCFTLPRLAALYFPCYRPTSAERSFIYPVSCRFCSMEAFHAPLRRRFFFKFLSFTEFPFVASVDLGFMIFLFPVGLLSMGSGPLSFPGFAILSLFSLARSPELWRPQIFSFPLLFFFYYLFCSSTARCHWVVPFASRRSSFFLAHSEIKLEVCYTPS